MTLQRTPLPARTSPMPRTPFRAPGREERLPWPVQGPRAKLPPRSRKTAKVYREQRVPLTQEMLADHPGCGIRWDERCRGLADALHEILSRGRGGSITGRANCIPACNPCNEAVSSNPAEAEKRGFLLPSGRPSKAVPR